MGAAGSRDDALDPMALESWASVVGGEAAAGHAAPPSSRLNEIVALWDGDITRLAAGAIVNAANSQLQAGGGVCGAIHAAAGPGLAKECSALPSVPTGSAAMTGGHGLPAGHVIHAVGPTGEKPEALTRAYQSSLRLASDAGLESIAFPCISTGIYGYPPAAAARVALAAVRAWLGEHGGSSIRRVVFCVYGEEQRRIYARAMGVLFPPGKAPAAE